MQRPTGPLPGTPVKNTMSETSFLVGFSFAPVKRRLLDDHLRHEHVALPVFDSEVEACSVHGEIPPV